MRHLTGLASIADSYDGFIVDLWGVIHDGVAPFPDAMESLRRLKGRPVLLLSNAPRRAEPARRALRRLGVDDSLYAAILTSGEASWLALRDRSDPWFATLGNRVYHLGPERDLSVIEGLALERVQTPADADFLLNTGPDDLRNGTVLDEFTEELDACLDAGLKMLCSNPDLEIVRGKSRILCAGALAAYYAGRGGEVRSIGKPDPAIYDLAVEMLGLPRSRLLAIGDSLRTDVAGAAGAAIDCVWVLGGIHAAELGADEAAIEAAAAAAGAQPFATLPALRW
jgi:HAD superfamily hydrolase (TIGR01459 family)